MRLRAKDDCTAKGGKKRKHFDGSFLNSMERATTGKKMDIYKAAGYSGRVGGGGGRAGWGREDWAGGGEK